MKKIVLFLLCGVILLSGCALGQTYTRFSTRNKLNKLDVGITYNEAISIMGNPYKKETLRGKDKVFVVAYYISETKGEGHLIYGDYSISDDELVPLVFDESKLIGWGRSFLEDNIQKYEIRLR